MQIYYHIENYKCRIYQKTRTGSKLQGRRASGKIGEIKRLHSTNGRRMSGKKTDPLSENYIGKYTCIKIQPYDVMETSNIHHYPDNVPKMTYNKKGKDIKESLLQVQNVQKRADFYTTLLTLKVENPLDIVSIEEPSYLAGTWVKVTGLQKKGLLSIHCSLLSKSLQNIL